MIKAENTNPATVPDSAEKIYIQRTSPISTESAIDLLECSMYS